MLRSATVGDLKEAVLRLLEFKYEYKAKICTVSILQKKEVKTWLNTGMHETNGNEPVLHG
jgi:hypothetical protein